MNDRIINEARQVCLEARDELLRMQEAAERSAARMLRLELALSCALPILEASEPGSEAAIVGGMIRNAIGSEYFMPPPRTAPRLVQDSQFLIGALLRDQREERP